MVARPHESDRDQSPLAADALLSSCNGFEVVSARDVARPRRVGAVRLLEEVDPEPRIRVSQLLLRLVDLDDVHAGTLRDPAAARNGDPKRRGT